MIKKGIKLVIAALLFGIIAACAFQGTNYLFGGSSSSTETADVEEETEEEEEDDSSEEVTLTTAETVSTTSTGGMDVSAIAESAMPSLVAITNISVTEMQTMFGQNQTYESESSGSGVIIAQTDTELLIVTNHHVISDADTISVGFIDESVYEAYLKGSDSDRDIAVIAVAVEDLTEDTLSQIAVIEIGSSDDLKVGEQVVAIGNALGYGQSVTTGIVSALDRAVTIDGVTNNLLQTDAAINPGNSGGALLNMDGQLVGINSAKYSDTSVEGMGYAIPIDDVSELIEELMNREARTEEVEESEQGYLGITGQDVTSDVADSYDMPEGVYVTSVEEGSAADEAGIVKGDIITKFDGITVDSISELKELIAYYAAGEEVEVVYYEAVDGEYVEMTVTVTLGYTTGSGSSSDTDEDTEEESESRGSQTPGR